MLELIGTSIYLRSITEKNRELVEILLDKMSHLAARQGILESRMGYEVTSIEISKQSKH